MVLEGYLSRALVDRFGRYVKGLDADNLRLSAWKGEVLLKNLRLIPEALSEGLEMPAEVKWAHVGFFHLSIPWTKLGSKPVCVTLEDVYILVAPLDTWSMDDMERQRRARYQKFRRVESRLRKHMERKATLMGGLSNTERAAGGKGMWARLLAKILDNVQVTVKNIHIRYEDVLTLDDNSTGAGERACGRPLSAGLTLRTLVAQTVDENWNPTYVQDAPGSESGAFVHKLVTVDSVAVYCDEASGGDSSCPATRSSSTRSKRTAARASRTSARPSGVKSDSAVEVQVDARSQSGSSTRCERSFLTKGLSDDELIVMFRASLAGKEESHSYVVIPSSPSLRLRVQRSGQSSGGPRCRARAFFNDVGVVLNNSQIANINKMRSTLRDLERWEALYRHRPKHSIKDGPKAWWVFLVKCVSRPGRAQKRAKLGWLDVVRLLALRKKYVLLYNARARHQATPEEYQQFTRLDEQLTANEIVAFRLKAIAELEEEEVLSAVTLLPQAQQQQPQQPLRQTWTEWLLRRGPASTVNERRGAEGQAMSAVMVQREDAAAQAEFLKAFAPAADGHEERDDDSASRVLWDVEASLNEGALTLVNAGRPCLRIICDLKAELQKKKRNWRLELGAGALQAFGLGGEGRRATSLLARRTWRPPEHDGGTRDMIQIGDFQVWKSGGVVIEYHADDASPEKDGAQDLPSGPLRLSKRAQGPEGKGHEENENALPSGRLAGQQMNSVLEVKVVLAPHQLMHDRETVHQVTSMFATRDMRVLTSAAQSKISRLQRATKSSFLHALVSNQRLEVTADIFAPLLVLPDEETEHVQSSLLVVDLGHIAFRRDESEEGDAAAARRDDAFSPAALDVEKESVDGRGRRTIAFGQHDGSGLVEDDWRLDISGVQVVVANASLFFPERPAPRSASLSRPPAETALVEGFDAHIEVHTTTDAVSNGLAGIRLDACLPRLSFNLRSSAYVLLARLLRKELAVASSGPVKHSPASEQAHVALDGARTLGPGETGHEAGKDKRATDPSRREDMTERSLIPGRDPAIKTVLSSDLEPVTEIPGEQPEGLEEMEWDTVGALGATTPRALRRSSGAHRHRRRRSSSGSSSVNAAIVEGREGGEQAVQDSGVDSGSEEKYEESPTGMALEVRVVAPILNVLLVHDDLNENAGAFGKRSSSGQSLAFSQTYALEQKTGADDTGDNKSSVETRIPSVHADVKQAPVNGALALVEITGLAFEYRNGTDRSERGVDAERPLEGQGSDRDTGGQGEDDVLARQICVTVGSFRVRDMHQQAGEEFAYLLSSSDPSALGGDGASNTLVDAAPTVDKSSADEAVSVTCMLLRPRDVVETSEHAPKTKVVLRGLWVNWNPETIGALSIFAHGMYGDTGGANGPTEQDEEVVDSERTHAQSKPPSPRSPSDAVASSCRERGLESTTAAVERAVECPESRGGVVQVDVQQVRVWLNKDAHRRRLLLLEANTCTVKLSQTLSARGNVSHYDICLRSARLIDLGTKSSQWRTLLAPSHSEHLPSQEVRLSIAQDSRKVEFPLTVEVELQSCAVNYLNQTWLEAFDYLMHGVLGDGPWCPWRLGLQEEGSTVKVRDPQGPTGVPTKRQICIRAADPVVKLPAGHGGEDWVALHGKSLTTETSYQQRCKGDGPSATSRLCQVWTVTLHGMEIRSSRVPSFAEEAGSTSHVFGERPITGCRLSGGERTPGDISVEAWWPMEPNPVEAEHGGSSSKYTVVGRAPGLDLTLHQQDYTILWQVLGENIAAVAPEPADSLPLSDIRDRSTRRQLVVYPYESTPPVGSIFDVTFNLPGLAVVAWRDGGLGTRLAEGGFRNVPGAYEVGRLRSRLLTWRMFRYADFRTSNAVIIADPILTERMAHGNGTRELFGSRGATLVVASTARGQSDSTRNAAEIKTEEAGDPCLVKDSRNPDCPSFRWRRMSWPDGGRASSIWFEGGGVLLSRRGWEQWRLWIAGTAERGQISPGEGSSSAQLPGEDTLKKTSPARRRRSGPVPQSPMRVSYQAKDAVERDEAAAQDERHKVIADLASAFDLHLSGTSLILEPWEYKNVKRGHAHVPQGREADLSRRTLGGDGSAVLVRVNSALRMTTSFFVSGHWAHDLREADESALSYAPGGVPAPALSVMPSCGEDAPNTTLMCCNVESLEIFSRASLGTSGVVACSMSRGPGQGDGFPGIGDRLLDGDDTEATAFGRWRDVLGRVSGLVTYTASPPELAMRSGATKGAERRRGCRRLALNDWSSARAIIRPSDIATISRALGSVAEDVSNERAERESSTSSDPSAGSGDPPAFCLDVDVRASGANVRATFVDDSGRHFVRPSSAASADRVDSIGGAASHLEAGGGSLSSRDPQFSQSSLRAEELDSERATVRGATPSRYVPPETMTADGDALPLRIEVSDGPLASEHLRGGPPAVPVVELMVGYWSFSYSANHGGVHLIDEQADTKSHKVEMVSLSMDAIEVTDLLQREPGHAVFRELFAIVPSSGMHWARGRVPEAKQGSSVTSPASARASSGSLRRPAEGAASRAEGDGTCGVGEEGGSRAKGTIPLRQQSRATSTSVGDSAPSSPSLLITYRKNSGRSGPTDSSEYSTTASQAPAEESREQPGSHAVPVKQKRHASIEGASARHARQAAATPGGRLDERTFVRVELGHAVAANWNPRTMVALWSLSAALSAGAKGNFDRNLDGGHAREGGEKNDEPQLRQGSPVPSRTTDVHVDIRRGLKVNFNKEKEGRQLLALSAASLELNVNTGCRDRSTDPRTLWKGCVEGVRATDPHGANMLYGELVGPPWLVSRTSSNFKGQKAPPLCVKFSYEKESGREDVTTGEGSRCWSWRPWEKSILSLEFSEAKLVYIQPLWLEVIDYLWDGVLGPAVWGGESPATTSTTDVDRNLLDEGGDGKSEDGAYIKRARAGEERGLRSVSEIHVTLPSPSIVLPGSLSNGRHLLLRPKTFRFSSWTGGVHDRDTPPRVEDCSPDGPVARHMCVEALATEITVQSCHEAESTSTDVGTHPDAADARRPVSDEPGVPVLDSEGETLQHALLRNPADVRVAVITVSPTAERQAREGQQGTTQADRNDTACAGSDGDVHEASDGDDLSSRRKDLQKQDSTTTGTGTEVDDARVMKIRVTLPRLSPDLTPSARETLTECLSKNILAPGFYGDVADTHPLKVEGMFMLPGDAGHEDGASSYVPQSSQTPSPPPSSSIETAIGSRGEGPAATCAACAVAFDELVSRHRCGWCAESVCRKCMHTQVSTRIDADAGGDEYGAGNGDETGACYTTGLICDNCASRTFPEFSVDPKREVHFNYGDDGPVAAMEIALVVPAVDAHVTPEDPTSFPLRQADEDAEHARSGGADANGFTVSAEARALELLYTRSAKRRGRLEASVHAVAITDLESKVAFPYIISPAPRPVTGEARPPQFVLSYHFSPSAEASIQMMVNHLEAVMAPSAIRKLKSFAKTGSSLDRVADPRSTLSVQSKEAAMAGSGTHDIAKLQLVTEGDPDAALRPPMTAKITLLNPVVMLPQNDKDGDSSALFLRGLVMANYVRSPRHIAAPLPHFSGRGGGGKEAAAAEARDASLEVIRLEMQVGRMYRGLGRPTAGSKGQILGGLGQVPAAIDPVTLSLHYSEVERALHPVVKDLKCQVEELVCQMTYHDVALFNTVMSGWAAGLSRSGITDDVPVEADKEENAGAMDDKFEERNENSDGEGSDIDAPQQIGQGRFYQVVFESRQLGLVLVKQDGVAVVEEVSAYRGVGGKAAGPFPGDELVAVAGEPTNRLTYDGVVDRIRTSPRPITLVFRRALFECWWGREYALDVSSWDGHHLDGIFLVGGGAGDQAVVGSAAAYRPKRRAGAPASVSPLRPSPGALLVSINSTPVSHLKLSAVKAILDDITITNAASTVASEKSSVRKGGGPSVPIEGQRRNADGRSDGRGRRGRKKIRLLLREVEVHAWPPSWRHEIQCPGVRVTIIDDREGRDMPLLRAEVGSLDLTHESGPGTARRNTRARYARRARVEKGGSEASHSADAVDKDTIAEPALSVSRTAASCDAQVDYYNATGGRWEPLLERVVAQGDREVATSAAAGYDGGRADPGANLASQSTQSVVRLSCFEEDVKINVTHAGLDVVLRVLRDWQDYRSIAASAQGKQEQQAGKTTSGGLHSADEAASASKSFAAIKGSDDGGAKTSGGQQRYSPFVLQNRTGLQLEFWAHQDKIDSVSRFGRRGTVVGGMADMPFSTSAEGRRNRRHASWLLSVRLLTEGVEDPARAVPDADEEEEQRFLNLPLKETGQTLLQCMLAMEGIHGAGGGQERPKRLRRCDAVWEVSLENGRHKVTLRSALEVVNRCGAWLEVRCSTDAFAAATDDSSMRREEVIGAVAPGARLPLPLKWSRAEDIRLRPVHRHSSASLADTSKHPGQNLSSEDLVPFGEGAAFEYSDCSVLVPAARAGETALGLTMSVIPWVACYPAQAKGGGHLTGRRRTKPMFLFMEGKDANDPSGSHANRTLFTGAETPSPSSRRRGRERSRSRTSLKPFQRADVAGNMPLAHAPTATAAVAVTARAQSFPLGRETRQLEPSSLSLRPLEVVVYASLSFRNLLPVDLGWRVVGARGDPGARVADGWLGPGEGAHVLEANTMAVKPSLSFQVPGFDWSPPRQVTAVEVSRRGHPGADAGQHGGAGASKQGEASGAARQGQLHHATGIGLEAIPCRNLANQVLYLNVEATSPRMNTIHVTVFAGYWVRNLSGLPLTLGEPIPTRLSSVELHEEKLADQADRAWRRSPSPPRQSLWDVLLHAVQSDEYSTTEEVFELRLTKRKGEEGMQIHDTRWCTAQGNPRPPFSQVRLPSELWRWEGDWTVDMAGAVAPNAPGTDGGGWESCPRKSRGGQYGSGSFAPSRSFKYSDPVWRRRWIRRRIPHRPSPSPRASTADPQGSRSGRGGKATGKGTAVIYQPATSIMSERSFPREEGFRGVGTDGRLGGAGLCVRVDDSAWSRPLNIAVQGAGGPFQVPGGRWPGLKRPSYFGPHAPAYRSPAESSESQRASHGHGRRGGVWGEGDVGVYELAYDVRVAPAPWNRTRIITVTSRYTVMNRCDCVLVVRQYGSNVTMELEPGESRPLHWADGSLEATLSVSVIPKAEDGASDVVAMDWSGPVGLGNIGTFPICIRPMPGGAALPADCLATTPASRGSSPGSRTGGSSSASTPHSSPSRGFETMPMVGANRILGVEVNIGRHTDDFAVGGHGRADGVNDTAGQGFRSSAVQVVFQEEAWGTGDTFPTYRLENHTRFRMFYGQATSTGPGDALPPGRSCLFGWDQPCPAEERSQGVLNLSLVLAPEPLSSPEGKRLAKTLNIRKLGEKISMATTRGRVDVVVEPDGPSKVVRMYAGKAFSLLSPPSVSSGGGMRPQSQRSMWSEDPGKMRSLPPSPSATRGRPYSARGGAWVSESPVIRPPPVSSKALQRSSTSPPATILGVASDARSKSPRARGASKRRPQTGDGGDEASLRELHVFCRAVRLSVVDGDSGEIILGSLEQTSLSVAATEREVEVKLNLGSLQIDSHMPGTSFPVILQPVRPGGESTRCIRLTLVAAPHVKNVTYIKLASLKVGEFDLRLDEGMVRWAQGLADRVLWTLVADRRANEMATWPLPQEAFSSAQAAGVDKRSGRKLAKAPGYAPVRYTAQNRASFVSRYVYLDVFQVSSVRIRLSLQRAKDSSDTVYVGVKPGQMLLDLMMRMDSAHIKLGSLIVHNATTTRSRLVLTAREHYERELKQQAFLMLGSLEAFGNPVGLLRGMGQGMQDFVKEPVLGLLKSVEDLAPEELMAGMARGAGSLLKHSVGGVANSVSLITGTVSQNLSTLAMDKDYKLRRARRKEARGEKKDLLDGLGSAGGSLARGLTDGVSGLIRNPMRGAEQGGFTGFAKGVGTGMLGLVVKPVVGVTDAATDVLQGVRSTTESIARIGSTPVSSAAAGHAFSSSLYHESGGSSLDGVSTPGSGRNTLGSGGSGSGSGNWGDGVGQVRPRRVLYGPERALRPYAVEDARAAALLQATRHKGEEYTAHLEVVQGALGPSSRPRHSVMVLTQSLVLVISVPSGELMLEQRLDAIQVVEKTPQGVLLHLRSPLVPHAQKEASSGFLGLPPPPSEEDASDAKGIACPDDALKRRLYDLLDAAVKSASRARSKPGTL